MSEGKYDPLYKIHADPTKVPVRAISRDLLQGTQAGDLGGEGGAGTGRTGGAARNRDRCGAASGGGHTVAANAGGGGRSGWGLGWARR